MIQSTGALIQWFTNRPFESPQALVAPGLVSFFPCSGLAMHNRGLHGAFSADDLGDRPRSGLCAIGQQAGVSLCDMEHDGARTEQAKAQPQFDRRRRPQHEPFVSDERAPPTRIGGPRGSASSTAP